MNALLQQDALLHTLQYCLILHYLRKALPSLHTFPKAFCPSQALYNGASEYAVFKWIPGQQKTKFHVVPRFGGPVKVVECPFDYMAFHFANAFESEDGQEIYVDVAVHDDPTAINQLYLDHLHRGKGYVKNTLS